MTHHQGAYSWRTSSDDRIRGVGPDGRALSETVQQALTATRERHRNNPPQAGETGTVVTLVFGAGR